MDRLLYNRQGRNERPPLQKNPDNDFGRGNARVFSAELLRRKTLVASNVAVELWTKDPNCWHGQMILHDAGDIQTGERLSLRTATESRLVTITDVAFVKDVWCVLFSQGN